MGLPDIMIEFSKKAATNVSMGSLGIVGIILRDKVNSGAMVLRGIDDIPTGDSAFTTDNTAYIKRAFLGVPRKVVIYTISDEKDTDSAYEEDYSEAFKYFASNKVNYIVGAPDISTQEVTDFVTWVKGVRVDTLRRPVAVLPNTVADTPCVISFKVVNSATDDLIMVEDEGYTEAEYCSRIAGLIAGIDPKISCTFKPLSEVTSIPLAEDSDVDDAIDDGYLTLYNDGERIVIARGINSLTTITETETEDLQKIKVLAIQDLIETDIYSTINNSYIGNYSNSYDNKCLLITAIKGYLVELEATDGGKGYLKAGSSKVGINVTKQKQYLESVGVDTSDMSEQDIKEANTGSKVFLTGTISILDAIEDVDIFINKE